MGGLWVDYERSGSGGLVPESPRNQQTNLPGLFAIGECDYQYHGANRLGANSLLSCIFSGLFVAPGIANLLKSLPAGTARQQPATLFEGARADHAERHQRLLNRRGGDENPYLLHQELGQTMTRSATVVRHNDSLRAAIRKVLMMRGRARKCALSDTGNWTNQNVIFAKALLDMFPLALAVLRGALARDECRGAHYKPDFALPGIEGDSEAQRRQEADAWCRRFEQNTQRWLKTTIAEYQEGTGDAELSYEPVDTSLIPPRPRLYGLVGAELIDDVWRQRRAAKQNSGEGADAAGAARTPVET